MPLHSQDERSLWNEKFLSRSHSSMEPDPLLVAAYADYVQPLTKSPGYALDLAGGTGRHSLWLVERGWRVTLLDISDVALAQAQAEAECRGLAIEVLNQDAGQAELGAKKFDLIMVFFFLDRALFPAITEALKPGGLLMYKTYTVDHPRLSGGRGPTHPMHLLKRNELVRAFSDLDMLFYREIVIGRGVAELVAQKPKVEVLGRRKTRRG